MPTNLTLPTYQDILERVKTKDWGHAIEINRAHRPKCYLCGDDDLEPSEVEWGLCPVRIAQVIKDAMVEAFKVSITKLSDAVCMRSVSYADPVYECLTELREAADALEKDGTIAP